MMTSDACISGMVGMGVISVLLVVALILGVGALAKYLFARNKGDSGWARTSTRGNDEKHAGT